MSKNAHDPNTVLKYFNDLGDGKVRPPRTEVLRGLAKLFSASSVGISRVDGTGTESTDGQAAPLPWLGDHELLQRVQTSFLAVAHQDHHGAWLICHVLDAGATEPVVCWAHRRTKPFGDGEQGRWLIASQSLLRWRAQNGASMAAVQVRLESAAVLASRLIHDFGNYLTGIMGFTELSQGQADPESTLGRYLHEVMLSAKQGADWIRRLHLFCRRGFSPSWPTLLGSVLQAEEARVRTAGSNLRWRLQVPANLPLVGIDSGSLQAAIGEIINNAREITREQGMLTVEASVLTLTENDPATILGAIQPGACVELTFTDDGPGFAPEAETKLFRENFYSTKPRHRGLGLLIVYGIMQRFHGGLRWGAAKNAPGAALRLYLPIALFGDAVPARGDAPHLLLVHDDANLIESMRRILQWRGWRVTAVNSALAALGAYQTPKQTYDLVLADVLMPGVSGLELARKILDFDADANFLFLYTQSSFHRLADEELVKRFALLRWPTEASAFVQAVETALGTQSSK